MNTVTVKPGTTREACPGCGLPAVNRGDIDHLDSDDVCSDACVCEDAVCWGTGGPECDRRARARDVKPRAGAAQEGGEVMTDEEIRAALLEHFRATRPQWTPEQIAEAVEANARAREASVRREQERPK